MYAVELSQRAIKFLEKLDNNLKERIEERLRRLKENAFPTDAKLIRRDNTGEKIFRYRIGDYRALYLVNENERSILIAKIDKRPRIYEDV